jgi:hypothetical protein
MKQLNLKTVFVIFCLFIPLLCPAKIFEQKDHYFKINAPEGWQCIEQAERVHIVNPQDHNGVGIHFVYKGKYSSEKNKNLLEMGEQAAIDHLKKVMNGTDFKIEERQLSGIYARQLTCKVILNKQAADMNDISLFYKGYAFVFTFISPDKNETAEMKKCVETIQFE